MWFLEHETMFEGKRMWLKPGSQELYGRTKPGDKKAQTEGKHIYINNKNVSRQHMMLKVLDVPPGDGTKLHSRSQVEITDLSCRQGIVIDGEKTLKSSKEGDNIVYDKMVLPGTEHTIKISTSYPAFKIKWQPTIITYASKENKESKARSAKLHALDIKTTTDFVYNKTTHVISQKRNLPKVLQGLIAGIHIVTSEYLDAILNVATSLNDGSGSYVPSKLEEDFDSWWPKEKDYIPPAGVEPVPRLEHMLEPDKNRSDVFSGLTFVFLNESQYNSLHEPISLGNGKALLFNVRFGETTVDEYVEFVRNTAGEKRGSKASNDRLPVVTIRLSGYPDGMEEWARDFVNGVDQMLNQRSILQNEFLDAIITNDKSSLQKPPSAVTEVASSMPAATRPESSTPKPTPASKSRAPSQDPEASPAPVQEPTKINARKRPIRRGLTTSRFTGFDDYEPPPKIRKVEDTLMEDIQESAPVPEYLQETQSRSVSGTQATRRRQPSVEESVEAADQIDELFPAAAAIRSRRAATRAASASVGPETQAAAHKPKSKGAEVLERLQKAKKKASTDINVREQTRIRIKEEEEKRRVDEESLREALEGVDISEIRGLVQVEEMEIRPRTNRLNQRTEAYGDRWNDEWNGRKNFKKFRRRGAERGPQPQKVIVTLEEAPQRKGFGVGDAFFLEETETARSKEDDRRLKRRTGRGKDDDSEPEPGFTRRKRNKDPEVINVDDSNDEDVFAEGSATQRNSGTTERVPETQIAETQTQTQRGARKRGPAAVVADQPASKRSRVIRKDDSSDDEETGFRFRRRG